MLKKITFLTLFPQAFDSFLNHSIIKRALEKGLIQIEIINFRDFSNDKNKRVDDYQFGGGPGMVIGLQAITDCLKSLKPLEKKAVWLTSPQGKIFNQELAFKTVNDFKELIIICGHYEGFDSRIEHYIDQEVSLGDFILTGGEFASQVMAESLIRLVEGVINKDSLASESFNDYLLDYPTYTKPVDFEGYKVPDVLLSGNHQLIDAYRFKEQIRITKQKRPDLYEKYLKKKGEK